MRAGLRVTVSTFPEKEWAVEVGWSADAKYSKESYEVSELALA